jgi:hypothetical protein
MRLSLNVVLAVLLSAGAGYAALHPDSPVPGLSARAASAQSGPGSLKLKGKVTGLVPGVPKQMRVLVRNRTSRTLTVRRIKARARAAGPGCQGWNLLIPARRLRLSVAPHHKRRTSLTVRLSPGAFNACQGRTFPLRFKARVTP